MERALLYGHFDALVYLTYPFTSLDSLGIEIETAENDDPENGDPENGEHQAII